MFKIKLLWNGSKWELQCTWWIVVFNRWVLSRKTCAKEDALFTLKCDPLSIRVNGMAYSCRLSFLFYSTCFIWFILNGKNILGMIISLSWLSAWGVFLVFFKFSSRSVFLVNLINKTLLYWKKCNSFWTVQVTVQV